MKRKASYLVISILLIFVFSVIYSQTNNTQKKNKVTEIQAQSKANQKNGDNSHTMQHHSRQALDCKSCHDCEYPTRRSPCLKICPRQGMISVYHSADEGPEVVEMDAIKKDYEPVIFSHKLHAQMSEMSLGGCQGCHHYNTTGPVLACKKCHESSRKREDKSIPDLNGAYHRQCMPCHRQWDISLNCNSCHATRGKVDPARRKLELDRIKGVNHPKITEPGRITMITRYEKGKIVTFYHDEHIKVFGINCVTCHKDENCLSCHNKTNAITGRMSPNDRRFKANKSIEEHHKPCNTCHKNAKCEKCHTENPQQPFNHEVASGWPLNKYHSQLNCTNCHQKKGRFEKLSNQCFSCHKNFVLGKFNHKVTGLALSANHIELDCNNCHTDKNFKEKPKCSDCHDDKSFPKDKPGKMVMSNIIKNAKSISFSK